MSIYAHEVGVYQRLHVARAYGYNARKSCDSFLDENSDKKGNMVSKCGYPKLNKY
jgi:hypothetical protein